jgi:hypothetical protein
VGSEARGDDGRSHLPAETATVRVFDLAGQDSPFASPREELQFRAAALLQSTEATPLDGWKKSRLAGGREDGEAAALIQSGEAVADAVDPSVALSVEATAMSPPRSPSNVATTATAAVARRRSRPSLTDWYSGEAECKPAALDDSPVSQSPMPSPSSAAPLPLGRLEDTLSQSSSQLGCSDLAPASSRIANCRAADANVARILAALPSPVRRRRLSSPVTRQLASSSASGAQLLRPGSLDSA